jgi:cytochrome c5
MRWAPVYHVLVLVSIMWLQPAVWGGRAQTHEQVAPDTEATLAKEKPLALPPGKGEKIVAKKCSKCHVLQRLYKATRSKDEWSDLLDVMTAQGLEMTPEERQIVLGYLTKNFAPRRVLTKP